MDSRYRSAYVAVFVLPCRLPGELSATRAQVGNGAAGSVQQTGGRGLIL
jgi:hypothetical protein